MTAAQPELSIVLVAHEMRRELTRTIRSLSPPMQLRVAAGRYELIVVDNGSSEPPDRAACERFGARIRWLEADDPSPSPAAAANAGLAEATAPLVGVMIDGARIASPGLVHHALMASRLHSRALIATLGFHLGPDVQHRSIAAGYDRGAEDELLESVDWTADGYRLFEISQFSGSSRFGWFETPAESNALFMAREIWQELGGYDERFRSPGGGHVNLDLFVRSCELPDARLVILLGEATFHQLHGGAASARPPEQRRELGAEYRRLRGRRYERPQMRPTYVGTLAPQAVASIEGGHRPWGRETTGAAPASNPSSVARS